MITQGWNVKPWKGPNRNNNVSEKSNVKPMHGINFPQGDEQPLIRVAMHLTFTNSISIETNS